MIGLSSIFPYWHTWVLGGYAIFGRGFAYIGYPPVYVGEISLGLGLLALLQTRGWVRLFRLPATWLLTALMVWGALRTAPYLVEYKVLALRDAVIWGYGLFALILGGLVLQRPHRLLFLLRRYSRFVGPFLVLAPVVYVIGSQGWIPVTVPGVDVLLLRAKEGDVMVHLAGVTAFCVVGLGRMTPLRWVLVPAIFLSIGVSGRAGMLAFVVGLSWLGFMMPRNRRLWTMAVSVVVAITILVVTDLRLSMGRREVSARQLVTNALSVISEDSGAENLDDTKAWRLAWWATIADYTIFGDYFWTGKGFGINLADDDGFQVTSFGPPLRSPHNGHITVLARAGVPGLVLWFLLHLCWFIGMLASFRRARNRGDVEWSRLFLFLLSFWSAMMVNASFDVVLEGPMGGIWFWSLFGVGLAAQLTYSGSSTATVQEVQS